MAHRKRKPSGRRTRRTPQKAGIEPIGLRIVGGQFRGRRLHYGGDPRVRPMKDRVREAVFNLVGPSVREKHAVDLFAGTGALALEALSRGAARATLVEQHIPTAATLRRNVALLGVEPLCSVVTADVFKWVQRGPPLGSEPWIVFCSPPYDFYVDRERAMLGLLDGLIASAPTGSVFVVECDDRFDFGLLPEAESWRIRRYPPAVVGIYAKSVEPD